MERYVSNEIVRLRRNRPVLVLPVLALVAGLAWIGTHAPAPSRLEKELPKVVEVAERARPNDLGPVARRTSTVGSAVGSAVARAVDESRTPQVIEQRRSKLPLYELLVAGVVSLFVVLFRLNPWPRRVRGELLADGEGLRFDGVLLARRQALAQGVLRPSLRADRWVVRVTRRGGIAHELGVPDEREGRRLLYALGLDASQRAARFWIGSLAVTSFWWKSGLRVLRVVLLATLGFLIVELPSAGLGRTRGVFGLVVLGILLAVGAFRHWPVRVTIGTDGVLHRWGPLARFVPFCEVERVESFDWGVRLVCTAPAPALELVVSRAPSLLPRRLIVHVGVLLRWLVIQRDLLLQRIEDARSARTRPSSAEAPPSRSVGAWMLEVRGPSDALERARTTLEDPWADPGARGDAAAEVLRALGHEAPPWIRAVAHATARPTLRRRLESIASEGEAPNRRPHAKLAREDDA